MTGTAEIEGSQPMDAFSSLLYFHSPIQSNGPHFMSASPSYSCSPPPIPFAHSQNTVFVSLTRSLSRLRSPSVTFRKRSIFSPSLFLSLMQFSFLSISLVSKRFRSLIFFSFFLMISLLHCLVWEFLVFALVRFWILITFQIRSFFPPFLCSK